MGLRDTVEANVTNAFAILGDLKQEITFSFAGSRNYDFDTGDVSESSTSLTVEGVIDSLEVNENKDSSGILDGIKASFIVNRKDLPEDYNQFDSFTTDSRTYKILSFKDNGYSVEGTGVGE